jgi:transcriptional regulator with XRE-family HTH domain
MHDRQNPIVEFRKSKGWDQRQLALATGIGYGTILGLEKGMTQRLSEKVLLAFMKVGAPEDLDRQYAMWREAEGAQIRGEIDPLSIKNPLSFD